MNESIHSFIEKEQVLRYQEVCKLLGISRSTLWRLITHHEENDFPLPIALSQNRRGIRFRELLSWIQARQTISNSHKDNQ